MKNTIMILLKGFFIGSSMSVHGVSGGTMAILLGIYDRLIHSLSSFFKDIRGNSLFLLKFLAGAALGIGSLAFVIKWLLEQFPFTVSFFFLGAVIGGIPALYAKTRETSFHISSVVYFLLGLIIVIAIGFIPTSDFEIASGNGPLYFVMLLVTGIIIAIALILPGISTSHMLIVLGMYDSMLVAITRFDMVHIGILCLSTLVGIFLITKPLEFLMNTYPHETYCMIIGFVLGSTLQIFQDKIIPAVPEQADIMWWLVSIVTAVVTFVLGYLGIRMLARFSGDNTEQPQ